MKEHNVICVTCGKQFDANTGAHYIKKSRRYQCMTCYHKEHAKAQPKQKNPKTAMIVKIVIGAFFILGAFACQSTGQIIAAIAIGAALIAWALIPYFKKKTESDQDEKAKIHDHNS